MNTRRLGREGERTKTEAMLRAATQTPPLGLDTNSEAECAIPYRGSPFGFVTGAAWPVWARSQLIGERQTVYFLIQYVSI